MTTNRRIARNLMLAAAVGVWLGVILARLNGVVAWPWVWVTAPYWVPIVALTVFSAGCWIAGLGIDLYLWIAAKREQRRRARGRARLLAQIEAEFLDGRNLRSRSQGN